MSAKKILLTLSIIPLLLLGGCFGGESEVPENVTGAQRGIMAALRLASRLRTANRPSAQLGVYVTLYMAQGTLFPSASARSGVDAAAALLHAQSAIEDESYALLQELGSVLQVDIPELLNTSLDRRLALDAYVATLTELSRRALAEETRLKDVVLAGQKQEETEQRREVRALETAIRTALREKDYALAASLQPELTLEETELARIAAERDQTARLLSTFGDLLDIAERRLHAIAENREVLLAGLKVVSLPGIEDLDVLEQSGRRGSRRGSFFESVLFPQ